MKKTVIDETMFKDVMWNKRDEKSQMGVVYVECWDKLNHDGNYDDFFLDTIIDSFDLDKCTDDNIGDNILVTGERLDKAVESVVETMNDIMVEMDWEYQKDCLDYDVNDWASIFTTDGMSYIIGIATGGYGLGYVNLVLDNGGYVYTDWDNSPDYGIYDGRCLFERIVECAMEDFQYINS